MSSVVKPNGPDVAGSRGVSSIRSSSYDNPKISSVIDGVAAVYELELEQDNDGNYSAKYWEWK
jgi:hypothetical protein